MTTIINEHETTIQGAIEALRELGQLPSFALTEMDLLTLGGIGLEADITKLVPEMPELSVADVLPDNDATSPLASLGVMSWQEEHLEGITSLGRLELPPDIDTVGAAMAAAGLSMTDLLAQDPLMIQLEEQQEQADREALARFAASYTVNQPTYCPHCGKHLEK